MVTTTISRYRLTYTPTGGEPMELLTPLDECDEEPQFSAAPQVQVDYPILAPWAAHHSRGGVLATLRWDRYVPAACVEQAEAEALTLWRALHLAPEGVLVLETAFMGLTVAPLVQWTMHATLSSVEVRELDVQTSPFEVGGGYHAAFEFNVTNPADLT